MRKIPSSTLHIFHKVYFEKGVALKLQGCSVVGVSCRREPFVIIHYQQSSIKIHHGSIKIAFIPKLQQVLERSILLNYFSSVNRRDNCLSWCIGWTLHHHRRVAQTDP